MGTEENKGV